MEYYEFKKEDAYEFVRVSGIQSKQRGDELQLLFCPYCRGGKNGDKGTFSISLVTGQFKCLRSSCSVSGNMVTLARDFDYFSLGKDIDAYYRTGKQKRFRRFKKMENIKPKTEAITYLESRKITAATAEKYQITVQSKHKNIVVFPFLDEKGNMPFIKYRKTDFNPAVDKGKEWCEANCKSRRGTIKDSSIKINRSKYNNHIRPVLGKIKVQKIEKRAVVKLQQDLSKKLSASMTNGVIVLLKTVLNAAVDDEILIKNPAASVKPLRKDDRPKASETIHRALTREEQQAFMQEAKTEWLYEFFCFSLCTGMRLNEITALKWQDIDYINNVIRVNKTVSWKEGGGIEETLPKSDTSNRDIPMNDTIKKILQMQKTKMSMVYGEIHARKMDSNIFIGSNGAKAIASSTVSSAIDNVLKRLRQQGTEIERFTHHAFRDTFATRYIEEGGNMQTLQKILGHSSLAMTADLYAHVLPNTKQQEMQQIENGFIGVAVL